MRVSFIRKTERIGLQYGTPHSQLLKRFLDVGFVDERIRADRFFNPIEENDREATLTDIAIYSFNRRVETDRVLEEMTEDGFHPATLTQGFCFAFQVPEHLVVGKPLAFLGSRHTEKRGGVSTTLSPFFRGVPGGGSFIARVFWAEDEWSANFEFLAIRA